MSACVWYLWQSMLLLSRCSESLEMCFRGAEQRKLRGAFPILLTSPVRSSPYRLSHHPPASLTEYPGFGVLSLHRRWRGVVSWGLPRIHHYERLDVSLPVCLSSYSVLVCIQLNLQIRSTLCRERKHCFPFRLGSLLCPWIATDYFWGRKLLGAPLCSPWRKRCGAGPAGLLGWLVGESKAPGPCSALCACRSTVLSIPTFTCIGEAIVLHFNDKSSTLTCI